MSKGNATLWWRNARRSSRRHGRWNGRWYARPRRLRRPRHGKEIRNGRRYAWRLRRRTRWWLWRLWPWDDEAVLVHNVVRQRPAGWSLLWRLHTGGDDPQVDTQRNQQNALRASNTTVEEHSEKPSIILSPAVSGRWKKFSGVWFGSLVSMLLR